MSGFRVEDVESLCGASEQKFEALKEAIRARGSALVAFSGGVDSALVLKVAVEVLQERAVALTALSASMAPDDAKDAAALAKTIGARHVVVSSNEINDQRYAANPANRCYFCKTELYGLCAIKQKELGLACTLDGFNADDRKDHRPGHQAAREHEVLSPLAAANLTKNEVRAWSHRLGLPTWDKPQMACLASRIPYGVQVTVERLNKIGNAEQKLRALGLTIFRVRYHGELARLEAGPDELNRLMEPAFRASVDRAVKSAGFTYVAVDLEPFRSGRMNDSLPATAVSLPVVS